MPYCSDCGKFIEEGVRFCSGCGAAISKPKIIGKNSKQPQEPLDDDWGFDDEESSYTGKSKPPKKPLIVSESKPAPSKAKPQPEPAPYQPRYCDEPSESYHESPRRSQPPPHSERAPEKSKQKWVIPTAIIIVIIVILASIGIAVTWSPEENGDKKNDDDNNDIPNGDNQAPVINSYSPQNSAITLNLGESMTFTISASDPDGDQLTYYWYKGSDIILNATTGSYTVQVGVGDSGSFNYKVTVSDGSLEVSKTWTITIGSGPSIDTDGDGAIDTEETLAGSNPSNPLSVPDTRNGDDSINDDPITTFNIDDGYEIHGSLNYFTDYLDIFKIELTADTALIATLSGPTLANFDLTLYSSPAMEFEDIVAITWDDYADETLETPIETSGTYYIEVWAWLFNGSYVLEIEFGNITVLGIGDNTVSGAQDLTGGGTITGKVDEYCDFLDYYTIDLEAGEYIDIILEFSYDLNIDLDLFLFEYDPVWDMLYDYGSSINERGNERIINWTEYGGTFIISVASFHGGGEYKLTVTTGSCLEPDSDNDLESSTVISMTGNYQGKLDQFTDYWDLYKLMPYAGQTLTFKLTGASGTDFDLGLFDENLFLFDGF